MNPETNGESRDPRPGTAAKVAAGAVVVAAFLFLSSGTLRYWDEFVYLHTVQALSLSELVNLETGLTGGLFPPGFFTGKLGFMAVLDAAVSAFGPGEGSLVWMRAMFASLTLTWAASGYLLFRDLVGRRAALSSAGVLLLLPLTVYLGQKVMSEMIALLPVTVACWCFVRAVEADDRGQPALWLAGSAVALAAGILTRISSAWLFVSFAPALWCLSGSRFPIRIMISRGLLVTATGVGGAFLAYAVSGIDPLQMLRLVQSVTSRRHGLELTVYGVGMTLQAFAVPVIASVCFERDRVTVFALVWLVLSTVPYLLGASYMEPRYLFCALLPLALLAHRGIGWLAGHLPPLNPRWGWVLVLLTLGATDAPLAPLMPYELDTDAYRSLLSRVEAPTRHPLLLTSWHVDYAFLRFVQPSGEHVLTMQKPPQAPNGYFGSAAVRAWLGKGRYLEDVTELCRISSAPVLVGWSYNPSVLNIGKLLSGAGVVDQDRLVKRLDLRHHLELSTLWGRDDVPLVELARVGDYRAYRVEVGEEICSPGGPEPGESHRRVQPPVPRAARSSLHDRPVVHPR